MKMWLRRILPTAVAASGLKFPFHMLSAVPITAKSQPSCNLDKSIAAHKYDHKGNDATMLSKQVAVYLHSQMKTVSRFYK